MEAATREVRLSWYGPFIFGTSGVDALPPDEPGVYVSTIRTTEGHLLNYAGQSAALLNRWYEHFHELLGCCRQLYDLELLRSGAELKILYGDPGASDYLTKVSRETVELAWQNATAYELYWATFPDDFPNAQSWRRAIESAILDCVIRSDWGTLVSTRRSVLHENAYRVRCISSWPTGVRVLGLKDVIEYGSLPGLFKSADTVPEAE